MADCICVECGALSRHYSRELCRRCYGRLYSNGSLESRPRQRHLLDRVEQWLETVEGTPGCWLWPYGTDTAGYGHTVRGGESRGVHRVVWELRVGPIPEGMTLDHECHNRAARLGECAGGVTCAHRPCANPADLAVRTMLDNVLDGMGPTAINSRKTHCDSGHALAGANLYIVPSSGHRKCLTCN